MKDAGSDARPLPRGAALARMTGVLFQGRRTPLPSRNLSFAKVAGRGAGPGGAGLERRRESSPASPASPANAVLGTFSTRGGCAGVAGVVLSIPRTQECRPGTGLRGLRELRGVCPYSFLRGVARIELRWISEDPRINPARGLGG